MERAGTTPRDGRHPSLEHLIATPFRNRPAPGHPLVQSSGGEGVGYQPEQGSHGMVENADDLKGRVKEAAGDLTGDEDLEREGKVDQATGKVKGVVDDVADKFKR